MSLKNMKIGARLTLGYGTVLLLVSALVLTTFVSLNRIHHRAASIKSIAQEAVPLALLASEMASKTVQVYEFLSVAAATDDPEGYSDADDAANRIRKSISQFKDFYSRHHHDEALAGMKKMEADFEQYYALGQGMGETYRTKGVEEGNRVSQEFDQAALDLRARMDGLRENHAGHVNDGIEAIIGASSRIKKLAALMGLLALILGSLVSIFITRGVTRPIRDAIAVAESVTRGNLTTHIKVDSKDEVGQLLTSMKEMTENLQRIAVELTGSSESLASHSEEVSVATSQIASGFVQQFKEVDQSAAATTELSQTLTDVAKNTADAAGVAQNSLDSAREGKTIVEASAADMSSIASTVHESANNIEKLGESSKQIGEIIKVIDDIADQTNLLALNAAIEAARAGEQGRGFAVVADEVRKLAEKTSKATEGISEMITNIQHKTEASVLSMEEGRVKAEEGVKTVERARESLNKIVQSTEQCLLTFQAIAAATEEQSAVTDQLSRNLENITTMSKGSQGGIESIRQSTSELAGLAANLKEHMEWFKVDPASGRGSAANLDGAAPARPEAPGLEIPKGAGNRLAG
jgi:methyl-accepting chemotaxis protein